MGEHNRRGHVDRIVRAEIWTVEPAGFPRPRPAVVVSIDPINDLCPDVLLVPLTTKPGPLRVAISDPAGATGLKEAIYAKCESVGPVHKTRLKARIGRISRADLQKIEAGLKRVLGLT
jgi:mRNA-degrading endonuclease toxin of MazEF toxin-antitoxin module